MSGARWALFALAAWSVVLSLETWFRRPGAGSWPAFPDQLERNGRLYRRTPAAGDPGELPPALTLLAAADYQPTAGGGGPPIRLRLLTLASSGTGVAMPVQAIGPELVGPTARGQCVVLDAGGNRVAQLPTNAAWLAWMAQQPPSRPALLAWLAGLRPYRANLCLWEGRP
ncbi:hypothetical protein FQK07_09245 [Synechococcus sp. BSF8S]|uniref:hypothetical protein n=1 Tax=Synechococcales TaxID=1890424 RepID=UPI001625138B|nr:MULTISPECIES: hypothetical protein [unclassified Synechococcus]MBC1261450.1 hypothetical protein [Synechococcus sp. BSF8S]MBC1264227.1 hypothetical protein [Synechococcus sp. BSA11S]